MIDGAALAKKVRREVAAHVADLQKFQNITPGLAVILVGDNPASQVYVRNKARACEEVGFRSYNQVLSATITEAELLETIADMNANPQINGILVQLPLPDYINEKNVLMAIDPLKDVDGLHPVNIGRFSSGLISLSPCTPQGCMMLINEVRQDLTGLRAVVIGRSQIVGKPMALMLLGADCTVTMAHSKTRDLPGLCREADILVAATGQPEMVRGDWVKPGAIVIDVGITRGAGPDGKLLGDVAFAEVLAQDCAVTPVPGGVGPMTIALLLQNTLQATMMQNGWI